MDIQQEKVDELQAVLKVKVEPEDYQENYEEALKKYRKQVNLPGFRSGKVPKNLIKKKYGSAILAEEVNKLLEESIRKYITENDLNILGTPLPKDEEQDPGIQQGEPGTFEFTYDMGFAPEFELNLPEKKFPHYKIKIDKEMVDEQVNNMAKRYGTLVTPEESGESDMLVGDFVQLDEEGNEMEEGIQKSSSSVILDAVEDEATKKQLTGIKPGTEVDVDPAKVTKGPSDMAAMLGIDKSEVENIQSKFRFKIQDVKRMQPAEIDQDLFDKVYGEGEVSSEEEFRKKIEEELSQKFQPEADQLFHKQAQDVLTESFDLELPDEFLKKYIKATNKEELTEEQIEQDYDKYASSLKWQLIEDKIIKENEIKVEQEEILNHTKGLLVNQYHQYGMPAPSEEELTNSAQKVLSGEEGKKIHESLYSQKVLDHLKENLNTEEKEISRDEFSKLVAEEYGQGEEAQQQ